MKLPVKLAKQKLFSIVRVRTANERHHVKHPLILVKAGLIFLAGVLLEIYGIMKRDVSTILLGLAIMLISLVTSTMMVKMGKRHGLSTKTLKVALTLEKKTIFQMHAFKKLGLRAIIYIIFLIFGIVAAAYFSYLRKDIFLLGVSLVIVILALIGIIGSRRAKSSGSRMNLPIFSKPKPKKFAAEDKAGKGKSRGERAILLSENDISRLRAVVKDKMKNLGNDKTPLDILYWLLQEKKQLRFTEIAKIFGIELKKVEEWARIFENHDIAEVNYPAFGTPLLRIKNNL